jgi:hypothetical protein
MFEGSLIDDGEHQHDLQKYRDETNKIKGNFIPRSVLTLENLFDLQSKYIIGIKPKTNSTTMMHFLVNLGIP